MRPDANSSSRPLNRRYDAVIVGARAAGASTAMLLAKQGLDVLVIDRGGYGTDTLSSHALMRGAVTQLERWGLADLLATLTPAITNATFHYGDKEIEFDTTAEGTKRPLMAPNRTVLDRVLVDAAWSAGATVRHHTKLVSIDTDASGRAVGVVVKDSAGSGLSIETDILIGADGLRSTVARHLNVPVTREGREASAYVLRHVTDLDLDINSYQWLYGQKTGAGVIPTVYGQHMVFAAMPRDRFRNEIRTNIDAGFHRVLDETNGSVAQAVRAATAAGPIRSWPGQVGQFRKAYGPGWALVGDAGYFKDPFAAHGISDAFRDAELLTTAVVTGDFASYETTRDQLSTPLFGVLEEIASYDWELDELPAIHHRLGKAMSAEQKALAALRTPLDALVVAA